jgi:azurin
MKRMIGCGFVFAVVIAVVGCQKSEAADKSAPRSETVVNNAAVPTAPAADPAPAAPKQEVVELHLGTVGDTMAFDKTKLTVPAGSKVHLMLKNRGTMAVMNHNWVLVKKGTEARVAAEGLDKAATSGYVVPGDDILAYTPMAPPGQIVEVTFDAPAPGTYPYICTYPGHYMVMKGELTVTP